MNAVPIFRVLLQLRSLHLVTGEVSSLLSANFGCFFGAVRKDICKEGPEEMAFYVAHFLDAPPHPI
jgi:hypothetical protein